MDSGISLLPCRSGDTRVDSSRHLSFLLEYFNTIIPCSLLQRVHWDLCKMLNFAQFRRPRQTGSPLCFDRLIRHSVIWVPDEPSLNLNKIKHFSKVSHCRSRIWRYQRYNFLSKRAINRRVLFFLYANLLISYMKREAINQTYPTLIRSQARVF